MILKELAQNYYRDAEKIKQREAEVMKMLETAKRLEKAERFRIRKRATLLRSMWREMRATAVYIDNYYERTV